jgi:Skp family chaperone for outer membrane proteins
MLKSVKYVVFIALSFGAVVWLSANQAAGAQAGAAAGNTGYKIGVVNTFDVFKGYAKCKAELDALEAEKDKIQAGLDRRRESINAKKERLQNGTNLTAAQREALRDEVEAEFRSYEADLRQAQGDLESKRNKFLARNMQEIRQTIQQIGSAENFHLILETEAEGKPTVLYFSNTINITENVISRLNGK